MNLKKKFDFINIGSLTDQKDQLTLLKAFKYAIKKNKNLKLLIIGEGKLKKKLFTYIFENKLNNKITILKNTNNINKYLSLSKTFILSSKYEGYPNVLLDAATIKLPIISTKCKFGPSEILRGGKFGKLFEVGDYKSLSRIMLQDYKLIKTIPDNHLKDNKIENVVNQYSQLFLKTNV